MHLLLISMPHASRRRQSGLRNVQATGLSYEIVDGVETSKWRTTELPFVNSSTYDLSAREIGCYLAHLRALRRVVDYGLPWACVLEDDFCFEANPDFGLAEIEPTLPKNFAYVHLQRPLDWNPNFCVHRRIGDYQQICETPYGATGYIISRGLAAHVLSKHRNCEAPIDVLYAQLSHLGGFYKPVKPIVGIQVGLHSDIHIGQTNEAGST